MSVIYEVSERRIIQERGTICDLCNRPLWQGEEVFILKSGRASLVVNSTAVTEPLCRGCKEQLLGQGNWEVT